MIGTSKVGSIVLVALLLLVGARAGAAQTIVERKITAAQPCRGLATDTLTGRVGIDRLEDVRLGEATASLRGDDLTLSLSGHLSCKTSDAATVRGTASADISASARGSLASCDMRSTVSLANFGGTFGAIIALFREVLESELEKLLNDEARRACEQLKAQ